MATAIKKYHARQAAREDDYYKQPQRRLIANHLLENHSSEYMRLLSLPGAWGFENYILRKFGSNLFVNGIERIRKIALLNSTKMIGKNPLVRHYPLLHYGFDCIETNKARLCIVEAEKLMCLPVEKAGDELAQKTFANEFHRHTAAWIDLMSSMTDSTVGILSGLGRMFDPKIKSAPFAITVSCGRDPNQKWLTPGKGALERRIYTIIYALNLCGNRTTRIDDFWAYGGKEKGSQRMMNVIGRLVLK